MVLEHQPRKGDRSGARPARSSYVVSLAGRDRVSIGRGSSTDIRVSDVSLSRVHANIHFEDGEFTIVDNDSKFGTLLQLQREHRLEPGCPLTLQVGCTTPQLALPTGGPALAPSPSTAPPSLPRWQACLASGSRS